MAGRYRALLIGNSTYPADEHNLQTLKGPVKDIAVLNRALSDRDTGLFADVDVTLLPEATSTRAVRALGTFFTTADRDDVLLVYFSGHGKLDQLGRLHLCMNDTETTNLLSTAVSSVRINEFADASRARNVVIILDCCYAGAFRGGEFGDTVAGPGRYVMTSCRGTQLANDATVDNGTSFFITQHLVGGSCTPPIKTATVTSASPTCTPTSTVACARTESRYLNGGWTATGTCAWPGARRAARPRAARDRRRLAPRTGPDPAGCRRRRSATSRRPFLSRLTPRRRGRRGGLDGASRSSPRLRPV
jgi:hypothetical protein